MTTLSRVAPASNHTISANYSIIGQTLQIKANHDNPEGKLITRKVNSHFSRKRPHQKIIEFRQFCTATVAGKKLQMGEV